MSTRALIDKLAVAAAAATFGDRRLPLPKDHLAQLADAAEALSEHLLLDDDPPVMGEANIAEDLLLHAAFAAVAYRDLPQAFGALKAAYELVRVLRAPPVPEPDAGRWERKADLMGGGR